MMVTHRHAEYMDSFLVFFFFLFLVKLLLVYSLPFLLDFRRKNKMKPLVKQARAEQHLFKKPLPLQPDSKRKAGWKARSSCVYKW